MTRQIHLNRSTRDLVHRVGEASVADKLILVSVLLDELAFVPEDLSKEEQCVLERAAALDEIRAVAAKLALAPGEWPTARQFTAHAEHGWTDKRVAKAFGRWQWAVDALNGLTRPTTEQRKRRREIAGRHLASQDPLDSIREWLATGPRNPNDRRAYDQWARVENGGRGGGAGYKLGSGTIVQRLGLPWAEVRRIASGEIGIDQATRRTPREKRTWTAEQCPHTFLCRPQVAARLDIDYQRLRRLENDAGFPRAALVLGNTPAWLEVDIDAYAAGVRSFTRSTNDLRGQYLTSADLAERFGVTNAAIRQPNAHAPIRDGEISGKAIWYLPHVEAWEDRTPPSPYSGRSRLRVAGCR